MEDSACENENNFRASMEGGIDNFLRDQTLVDAPDNRV